MAALLPEDNNELLNLAATKILEGIDLLAEMSDQEVRDIYAEFKFLNNYSEVEQQKFFGIIAAIIDFSLLKKKENFRY